MSRSLNKAMLIGNLGRDPELRHTTSGKQLASFSIACDRSWNSGDGVTHKETDWFNIVAWGNLAEFCMDHLKKGQQVYVEGRLQSKHWEDKDGNNHHSIEIVAGEMMILGDHRKNDPGQNDLIENVDGSNLLEDEFPF